ncbi:MAG: cytochrome c biogenesis protein CcsA [Planctomycetaceae bacterium]
MASETISDRTFISPDDASDSTMLSFGAALRAVLAPLASLKLTVALFAMAIFIVFAGTFAQVDKDIWQVVDEYFRVPLWPTLGFARIDFQIFFPGSFFPSQPVVPGYIYFPGGWLIGATMFANLMAAHGLRFKVQARGTRLMAGLVVIAVGCLMTWLVIASGSNKDGVQEPIWSTWSNWSTLWLLFKVGLVALWVVTAYAIGYTLLGHFRAAADAPKPSPAILWVLVGFGAILSGALAWIVMHGEAAQLNDSSMRILWQLLKAEFAALVLLAGCILLFKKRAGIVLLHAGVALMMFSEFLVGTSAVEGQIMLGEGEAANFTRDIRSVELAVVDGSDPDEDRVVVIPRSRFPKPSVPDSQEDNAEPISHSDLPFDVTILRYYRNSDLRRIEPNDINPADSGAGKEWMAVIAKPASGTDPESPVDLPSLYVRFSDKQTGASLGTRLLNLIFTEARDKPEKVTVGDKTYDVALRFKRSYKPYSVRVLDVRKDDYLGTSTVRNYSSEIRLVDQSRNVDFKRIIWMNNPLRFAGETFYQQNYSFDPQTRTETTTLQVVTNAGWMIPYVACMIVGTGMWSHFGLVLLRFLNRGTSPVGNPPVESSRGTHGPAARAHRPQKKAEKIENDTLSAGRTAVWVPLAIVLICLGWIGSKAIVPETADGAMNLYQFGKVPIVYQGRTKPMDTLARNSLRMVSNRQTFVDEDEKKQPAIRWLLDVISESPAAEKHNVFRIDHPEVLKLLNLKPRNGYLYSFAEIRPKLKEFDEQSTEAKQLEKEKLSAYQRKLLDARRRIEVYWLLVASFRPRSMPVLPTREEFEKDPAKARQQMMQELRAALQDEPRELLANEPPLAIPMAQEGENSNEPQWQPYATAVTKAYVSSTVFGKEPDPATIAWATMINSYAKGDASTFNKATSDYLSSLKSNPPKGLNIAKTNFEAYFNHLDPFFYPAWINLLAFVLAAVGLLGWSRPLNRASFWLIVSMLVIHTFALVSRMYLTDRWLVMVTNLYSSAVFIGWAGVVLGLTLEMIYGLGIGNLIASAVGFSTLLISHFLALDGDTLIVMQAVLDTNFWLATHVTCVTLGYATTFVAGALGVAYVLLGVVTPVLSPRLAKEISRMIYGTICFAIFFSFVGTVLGGLWADDSWGRFWGWDPKENGALIIVLWNALILHARWGGIVKERGLAVLAVVGNIVTSWSWFGVNELGVGLHSYGFTEGVLLTLGIFIASQLAIVALGCLPKQMWASTMRWAGEPR